MLNNGQMKSSKESVFYLPYLATLCINIYDMFNFLAAIVKFFVIRVHFTVFIET